MLAALLLAGYTARALDGGSPAGPRPLHRPVTAPARTPSVPVPSSGASTPAASAGGVALSALPPAARTTVGLIRAGGPFPDREDGEEFRNDERLLPLRPAGYYHAYTVPTPGDADRGPRRLVTGAAGEVYYTADHYGTFVRVDVGR